nr:immunoglobulin heavy chain junction region [Mus musculus]
CARYSNYDDYYAMDYW